MSDERLTFKSGDLTLEAALLTPAGAGPWPGVVVCHPHPLYGGDMDNNVVMAICQGLTHAGIAALRFNFRGVGDSEGSHDQGKGEQQDALAALAALRADRRIDGGRTGVAGYSFGAGIALVTAPRDPGLKAIGVVAPPTTALGNPALQADMRPKMVIAGEQDSAISIVQVRALLEKMVQPVELVVLSGADHFMWGREGTIAEAMGRFFARGLAAASGAG